MTYDLIWTGLVTTPKKSNDIVSGFRLVEISPTLDAIWLFYENSIWNIVILVTSLQFSIFSCRGCGRGHSLTAEKNEMLHPWHYKRSRSSKRSPLPYSHSQWYWHLVFLWSFVLIKKKRKKNSCHGCNWSVFVSCELVVVYVAFFFNACIQYVCVCMCTLTLGQQDIGMDYFNLYHEINSKKIYFCSQFRR